MRFLTMLLAAGLFLTAAAAPSQAQVSVTLGPTHYAGTVHHVAGNGVYVNTAAGQYMVPATLATFKVGGVEVNLNRLVPGTPVQVYMPPVQGQMYNIQNNMVGVYTPYSQQPVYYPVNALPVSQQNTMVYVQMSNGQVVHVPIDTALLLQSNYGARIVGQAPQGCRVVPTTQVIQTYPAAFRNDNGRRNGWHKSKWKAKKQKHKNRDRDDDDD